MRALGAFLTVSEADSVAARLVAGESFTGALAAIGPARRPEVTRLASDAGLRHDPQTLAVVLRAIAGARDADTDIGTLWTMPGHLAQTSPLTTSIVRLVAGARTSIVCSTFNFQETSGLWEGLRAAAGRPEIDLRVYVDARASDGSSGPSSSEISKNLRPGVVLQTRPFEGKAVRNHAKLVCVDHRFLVVTSANFSWSAEYGNVELGITIDNPGIAASVERELRRAEERLYKVVPS
ncbi:DISARM system phospholipase D-like protein DrmC [Aquipuribacter nitratireducens]|uniref:DISARM system phospholipase D-like protein DrmC n=1 Tax=Aquipuribacter nitratireducens TaxID=650104 RepID=A0ABW0GLJ6_9MICO